MGVGVVLGDSSSVLHLAFVLRRWGCDPIPPQEEARRRSCTSLRDSTLCSTTASALGDCGRSFRDSGTASHDVHRTICDDSRASRVLRWAPPCCVKALKVCWTLILGFDDTCRGSAQKKK